MAFCPRGLCECERKFLQLKQTPRVSALTAQLGGRQPAKRVVCNVGRLRGGSASEPTGEDFRNRRPSSAIKPSSHDWTEGDALQLRSRRIIKMLLSLSVACASCRPALHVSAFPLLADATTSRHPPVACKLGFGHLRRAFSQSDMKAPFHSDDIDAIDEKIHQQTIAIQQCADEDECLLEEVRTPTSRALQPNSFVLTPSVPCPSPS